MTPGRNEPCPCGSGRKFKHCCGATGASDAATPTGADREAAWNLLDRVSCLPRFQDDIELGFILIWGEEYDDPGVGTLMDTMAGDLFYEWLWLDHQLHTGRTIAEHAIEKHAREVGPASRQFLRACVDAPLRLLQVDRVEIGERVHVRDVLRRGPTIAVTERQGSKELARHDVLTTRIAKYDDQAQFEGMSIRFSVDDKKALATSIRRLQRPLTEEMPAGAVRERLLRTAAGAAIDAPRPGCSIGRCHNCGPRTARSWRLRMFCSQSSMTRPFGPHWMPCPLWNVRTPTQAGMVRRATPGWQRPIRRGGTAAWCWAAWPWRAH